MSCQPNVLCRVERPTRKSYAAAVAEVVRGIKSEHRLSNRDLADRVGCSEGTIENADNEDKEHNLSAVTLLAIELEFGPGAINSVLRLAGVNAVAVRSDAHASFDEVARLAAEFGYEFLSAVDPAGDGGSTITKREDGRLRSVLKRLMRPALALLHREAA